MYSYFLPYTFGWGVYLTLIQANTEVFFSVWRYPVAKTGDKTDGDVPSTASVIEFPPERIVRKAA